MLPSLKISAVVLALSSLGGASYAHPLFRREKLELLRSDPPSTRNLTNDAKGTRYKARYTVLRDDARIPLAALHDWTVEITPLAGATTRKPIALTLRGDMPQHLHGLASTPAVAPDGEGRFVIRGLRFHMPGWWRLEMKVEDGAGDDVLVFDLEL